MRIHGMEMILALCAIWAIHSVNAWYGLDTELSKQMKLDPLGTNDTFVSLRPKLKKLLSQPRNDIHFKIDSLQSLQSTTLVTVKLVGFSSDDRQQLEVQFGRYLEVVNKEEHVRVIGTGSDHQLLIKSKIQVEVVRVTKPLSDTIFNAIEKQIDEISSSIFHQPVSYKIVDDIIQTDLEQPLPSYVFYILNLKPQKRSYAYDYNEENKAMSLMKCLGNFWAGKERYAWIDLAAGPIEYGPALSGEGLILKGELYALAAALHGASSVHKALLADLASLVWSASQMMFAPALRIPVYFYPDAEVHFYHIRGSDISEDDKTINWGSIEQTFVSEAYHGLLLQGQSLNFKRFIVDLSKCAVCSAVLARSIKTYSSRVLLDEYSLFVNEYLDSKQLHYLLSQVQQEVEQIGGRGGTESGVRVIPVFVFDLSMDRVLLLDRHHQAMAFADMVIAVRTKGFQTVTEYNCNSRPVVVQNREIERPVVAAILQTVWGVAPTHLTWSKAHNSSFVDYSWSLGHTPFGPFSDLMSLSFVQKDAAPRNVLYSTLNSSLSVALEILRAIRDEGGEKKLLNKPKVVLEYTQRWNLFMYKLDKGISAISHLDFNSALFFINSAEHDLFAIHSMVYEASSNLEASITCFTDPPFPWFWILTIGGVGAAASYIFFRREQLFSSKKKRF